MFATQRVLNDGFGSQAAFPNEFTPLPLFPR